MNRCEILVVTCAAHFDWLDYCLQSIARFARGFSGVTVVVPQPDLDEATKRWFGRDFGPQPVRWPKCGEEWPGKGFLWHMAQILNADQWCPDADFLAHVDSDCIFVEPVTPDDYIQDSKPILYYEAFETITRQHPDVGVWQTVTQACLPFPVRWETMRKHPGVFHHGIYQKCRELIFAKTGVEWDSYIKSCREEFPNGFCEFNALGNVAMEYFKDRYIPFDTGSNPWPTQKLVQFWSKSPPTIPQKPYFKGQPFECTPQRLLEML